MGWINVKDKLPEEYIGKKIITYNKRHGISTDYIYIYGK
jgi:hypothetical protein